ncbi:class I SAM-dependent methyltransferase [candidate division KSB1 bacterium]|nr:MAG: class I SAM-dependent methyltransferase [candidate division KSB1 bacterium]
MSESNTPHKHHICPWWMGYFLASPLRRWMQNPAKIISPYVHEGMTVLEPGPGMGFFTLEIAERVGFSGRVIVVDVQQKMLDVLMRKAKKKGLADRIDARLVTDDGTGTDDLAGKVDLVWAFAVVHELPDMNLFFREAAAALKTGGKLYLAEPSGHVNPDAWAKTIASAKLAGLAPESEITIPRSRTALLAKS